MKKYIILSLVMTLMLVSAVPILADECSEGSTWVPAFTEGYFTDGECNSWSETTCLSSHKKCTKGYWHWSWSNGNHYHCTKYKTVCDSYSTPECLGYDQIWHEPVDEGTCEADEVPVVEPEEPKVCEKKGGGVSFLNYTTKIASPIVPSMFQDRCYSFLGTHYGQAGLLLSSSSQQFPLNSYNQPMLGDNFGSVEGYQWDFLSPNKAVYHTVCLDRSVPSGTYYARPYLVNYDNHMVFAQENGLIYGQEQMIIVR